MLLEEDARQRRGNAVAAIIALVLITILVVILLFI